MHHYHLRMPLELWTLIVLFLFKKNLQNIFFLNFKDFFNEIIFFETKKKKCWFGHLIAKNLTFIVMISSVTLNCVNSRIFALFNFCFWLFCYFWHIVIFLLIYLLLACEKNIGCPVIPLNQFTTCLRWYIFNLNLIDSPWTQPNTTCLLGLNKKLGNPHYTSDLRILQSTHYVFIWMLASFV